MTDCPYINLKSDRYPTKKETEYEEKKERENRSVRPPPIPTLSSRSHVWAWRIPFPKAKEGKGLNTSGHKTIV